MSSLVGLRRKAETIQGYEIRTPADMLTALQAISELPAASYTGSIQYQSSNGGSWQLLINNATANTSQVATMNDWIVIENHCLVSVCKCANFASLFCQG